MHKIISIIAFLLVYYSGVAQTKITDTAQISFIRKQISKTAMQTETIASEFTQEKKMSILNDRIITTGKFYFKKENLLRWEYTHPFSYIIIIRNHEILIRDEDQTKSYDTQSSKVFSEVNKIILGSVRGTLLYDEKNFISSFSQNHTSYVVTLTPVSQKIQESLQRIVMFFNRKNFTVDRLEMHETAGDCTIINFTDKHINQPISDEKFFLD